jgi:phosphatidate phosphatase PAH1
MKATWVLPVLALTACAHEVDGIEQEAELRENPPPLIQPAPPPAAEEGVATPPKPVLRRCVGRTFTPDPKQKWKKWTSGIVALGRPRHAGRDEIVAEGASVTIKGKFAYGSVSKDLEGETVRLFIDDCTGWKKVADLTTNSDGRAERNLGVLPLGVYEIRFQVMGDQSLAPATLWVLPRGTHLTVFDIDGTLTIDDGELVHEVFSDIFFDEYVPQAYPSARELVQAHEGIGHIPVYLTGRPYWLTFHTRRWLTGGDFPLAPLRVTDSNTTSLPTEGNVGTYKKNFLTGLQSAGFVIDFAYGNASTDIYAYLGAGIPAALTWIIGKHAGEQGTNAVTGSWAARTAEVENLPAVEQPFQD